MANAVQIEVDFFVKYNTTTRSQVTVVYVHVLREKAVKLIYPLISIIKPAYPPPKSICAWYTEKFHIGIVS